VSRLAAVTALDPPASGKSGVRRGLVETQILELSAELFARQGFAATSLQDIAESIGISRPALYHYFSSKDEILARLTDGLITSAGTAVAEAMAQELSEDKQLSTLIRALTVPIAEAPGRFRLLLTRDSSISDAAQGRLHELEAHVIRSMAAVIERGITSGAFRRCEPRTATFAVLGMINWVAWWYTPGGAQSIDEVSEQLVDFALTSLRSPSTAAGGDTVADTIASMRRELDHLERLTKAGGNLVG
jgi:AcrR family transcriptional regulator